MTTTIKTLKRLFGLEPRISREQAMAAFGRRYASFNELLQSNADLAAILAMASSFRDKPVPHDLTAIGEVGLTGELRAVSALGQRLAEVRRLGFTKCLVPKRIQGKLTVPEGLELIRVGNIREALAALL